MESLIEEGENRARTHAGFANAAERAHRERGIQGGRKTLAGDVADVKTEDVVGKGEIVQVVAADFGDGLKLVRDEDVKLVKRLGGEHGALNDAGLFELLFAPFFDGKKILHGRGDNHGNVRRGKVRREGVGVTHRIAEGEEAGQKSQEVVTNYTTGAETLESEPAQRHNPSMRALFGFLVAVAIGFAVYEIYLKQMPSTDQGTAPTQAISLTGVRSDLLQIAQAERGEIALNNKCVSLEELVSSGALTMNRKERDGYTYEVSCSGADFQVIAGHAAAPEGSGIRYPKLVIDSTMQVREIQ